MTNKLVNGESVPMTAQEISARQAEESAWAAGAALRAWKERIQATDAKIPRAIEDIIDALDNTVKSKIAQETLDAYTEKKQIRAEQP